MNIPVKFARIRTSSTLPLNVTFKVIVMPTAAMVLSIRLTWIVGMRLVEMNISTNHIPTICGLESISAGVDTCGA